MFQVGCDFKVTAPENARLNVANTLSTRRLIRKQDIRITDARSERRLHLLRTHVPERDPG
ncbi:MAG: hypothetical protein HBSAPP02_17490 [Phycisphaerae bacterium]|nr:MAG: hypothetical protein HBSAPP02_17490 [Phycisphaerae bacterium]